MLVSIKALKVPHYSLFSERYTSFQTAKEQPQRDLLSKRYLSCQHGRFAVSFTCLEKKENPKIKIGFKRHLQYCPFHRRLNQGEAELTSRSRTGFTLILLLDKMSNFEI